MKIIVLLLLFWLVLDAQKINMPKFTYHTSGGATDLLVKGTKLYVATDAGCIDIFELHNSTKIQTLCVEKILDFMGDLIDSKIYSVDIMKDKMLVLSQTEGGFRRLHLYQNGIFEEIISKDAMLSIAKAKFLDDEHIIMALLGSELLLYNIAKKESLYRVQISQSKFSDFALDEAKKRVVIADESGALKIHNTKNAEHLELLQGQNLDNVFKVDMKNNHIITAGQDRRVVVYNLQSKRASYVTSSFLVYTAALSPSGKMGAYSSDESNNVTLFDTVSHKKLGVFGGNRMTLTNILFLNETSFLVGSDDKRVNFYSIDE